MYLGNATKPRYGLKLTHESAIYTPDWGEVKEQAHMTLTSEKTATKRHAWLVGATTAAMAVALIGVGPIAANAAGTGTPLTVTVAAQSFSAPATTGTVFTFGATTGTSIAADSAASEGDTEALTAKVTNASGTDVTSLFTVTTTATDSDVTVTPNNDSVSGVYTLTLTPTAYVNAPVTGAVSESFTVEAGSVVSAANAASTAPTTAALTAPLVQLTTGQIAEPATVPSGSNPGAVLSQNGAPVSTIAAGSNAGDFNTGGASSVFDALVPAGATYTVVSGTTPTLAAGGTTFAGTAVVNPSLPQSAQSVNITSTQTAPATTPNVAAAVWSAPTVSPFNDVTTSTQFYSEMSWLNATGISTGYADGGYHPAATIKRNAEAAFLYRLAGSPTVTAKEKATTFAAFSDVNANTQFSDAIVWLYMNGITTGYANGTFQPASNVTRGAMAAFLYRFANNAAYDTTTDTGVAVTPNTNEPPYQGGEFSDVYGATQFSGDIQWLVTNKITTGYANGSFQPTATIKRNAMATFLYRLAGGAN